MAQEKFDGNRCLLKSEDTVIALNKKGTQVGINQLIAESINNAFLILDGELIGDRFVAFDLITDKNLPCEERIRLLNNLSFGSSIEIAETAYTTEEKQAMFDRLKATNKEGIVFKLKTSLYKHGRPSSLGSQLKWKFQKSATCIVANHTTGKRSIGLEIIDGDKRVSIGKCTIPPNHEMPSVGSLVEIQYLYCISNLFQPVYKGVRTDSDLTDCTISQIVYKAED